MLQGTRSMALSSPAWRTLSAGHKVQPRVRAVSVGHQGQFASQRLRSRFIRCTATTSDDPATPQDGPELHKPTVDLNQLQTRLNIAVAAEDYALCAKIKAEITEALGDSEQTAPASWQDLECPPWLADRAERMGYLIPNDVQRRSAATLLSGSDAVIRAQTGSGKTFAYLMPVLAMLQYPPDLYLDDMKGPQAVIVVPHRDLGVQIALLIYRLFGGSINPGVPGNDANMFTYSGPRGIRVRGVLDKAEVLVAKTAYALKGCHVVVGTPDCLAEVNAGPEPFPVMEHAKIIVVDEADECLERHMDAMRSILGTACGVTHRKDGSGALVATEKPVLALVGASMNASFCTEAIEQGWLRDHVDISGLNPGAVPASTRHRFVVIPEGMPASSVLTKLLRLDMEARGPDAPPPRVITFVNDTEQATKLANPLRNALWEEHKIGLLLPDGEKPTATIHEFRDNLTSMLLATPSSARGLDLPAVTHVYNMGLPATTTEYLHRAGRTGRTGSDMSGVITTLVAPDDVPRLLEMTKELNIATDGEDLAVLQDKSSAGKSVEDSNADGSGKQLDSFKKQLEDLINLY